MKQKAFNIMDYLKMKQDRKQAERIGAMLKITQRATVIIAAAASLCAGTALGAAYEWGNTTTAATLGPETYIDSLPSQTDNTSPHDAV